MHRVEYYDRQGIIRSNGVGIVTELPHCLDLLLSFQRFTVGGWIDLPYPSSGKLLCLDAKQYLNMDTHYGACHLAQETNRSLKDEHEHFSVAMSPSVTSNTTSLEMPLVLHGSISGSSVKSHRVFKMNVIEELVPLTSETGKSFVDAWLDVVTCTFIFDYFSCMTTH